MKFNFEFLFLNMKSISNFIESIKAASPDLIIHKNTYAWDSKYARPIIYDIKTNNVMFGDVSCSHNDMLMSFINTPSEIRTDSGMPVGNVIILKNGGLTDRYACGRIFVIPTKNGDRKHDVYVTWWDDCVNGSKFIYINKIVIKRYNKKYKSNIDSFVCISNKFDVILVNKNNTNGIEINNNDNNIEMLRKIHLATQEEKRKFYNDYRKNKYDYLQKTLYNSTKSKTAAEFNNNKVKRYNINTGKMEYGEKIGDSLIMKNIIDYILERKTIGFGEANPKYGQCIILAGGAASGKGFIQKRIDMQGKVFDVDELKHKYQRLAKAGVFDDTYDYDLTNPEDTGRLHQKVKETGMKHKQRDNFWSERENKSSRHSSGLLPNVIFDMVSDDIKDVEEIVTKAKGSGYNVTIVWVVCNKQTAITSNTIRGIDRKGKARSVLMSALEKGHAGAYKTMVDILSNKYPELNEFIDGFWIGYSSGWGRKLSDKYVISTKNGDEESPVFKVNKDDNNKFNFNKSELDSFINTQQPIDYQLLKKIKNDKSNSQQSQYNKKKLDKFIEMSPDFKQEKLNESKIHMRRIKDMLIEGLIKADIF